ncbi:ABC transporter ATP-binding protein [Streptomyces sp. NPDC053560]|uniref:ABC transporter ATP-binding protein n=1 Tax=Streptomyces sp. NPDC053560 TaxID=3365711 RepID=UPI0037D56B1F
MGPPTVSTAEAGAPGPLLRAASRHSAGRLTAVALCSVAASGAALTVPTALGHAVDVLLSGGGDGSGAVLLCAALLAAEIGLDAAVAWLGGTVTARSTSWLRHGGIRRLLTAAPHRAGSLGAGDLTTRLTANTADAGTVPVTTVTVATAALPPVGALVALFVIDAWAAVAFLAGVPLLLLLLRTFVRGTAESNAAYQRLQATIAGRLGEALVGARTIAAAGTGDRERDRVLSSLPGLDAQGRRMWRVYGRAMARGSVLMPLLTTVVLAVGGLRLVAGQLSVGDLLALSRYATLAAGVGAVTGALNSLARGRAAARRVAALEELPPLRHGGACLPADGNGALELRDVVVDRDGKRLLDVPALRLPGGTTTAVVGPSGSGKTLLAAVAGRLLDPDTGTVLLDGVPLPDLTYEQTRRAIGTAFARPVLFGPTVEEALACGPRRPTPPEVREAARAAGADGFVTLLPDGYRTCPDAAPLSGGERQRLGLARAFVGGERLLIMDDATSSLDTVTEQQVNRALLSTVRAPTRLIVAHRPSCAALADKVVWLERGKVRATGSHQQLWQDPDYRANFTATGPPVPTATGAER